MSRSLRPICSKWGPASSVFVEAEQVAEVLYAVMGTEFPLNIDWQEADEAFLMRLYNGREVIEALKTMDIDNVLARLDLNREDAESLLTNLKALAQDWKEFVDKDNQLEILID